jgi:hypothetical protein
MIQLIDFYENTKQLVNTININDKSFTDKFYIIELLHGCTYRIFAYNEADAIDILIDYFCKYKNKFKGYFFSSDELSEFSEDDIQNYIFGGNYCKYITFQYHEIRIKEFFTCDKKEKQIIYLTKVNRDKGLL